MNVLVLESGGFAGIVTIDLLKKEYPSLNIIAADCDPNAVGLRLADIGIVLPHHLNENYLKNLIGVCLDKKVDAIMPTFEWGFDKVKDLNLPFLTDLESASLCKDKLKFSLESKKSGLNVPETYLLDQVRINPPFLIKPRYGSGSRNIHIVKNKNEINHFSRQGIEYLAQELLTGEHYSVDVLVKGGSFVLAVPRKDILVKAGHPIVVDIEKNGHIIEYARKVTEVLGIQSPFNLEGFWKDNIFTINEINVRFGSGVIFSYLAGINFPAHTLGLMNEIGKDFKEGRYTNLLGGIQLDKKELEYRL